MTVKEAVLEKLDAMPTFRQQELLEYAEFLESKSLKQSPRRSLEGIWADLNIDLSEEDLREARKEMWGNFPREHFYDEMGQK